MARDPSVKPSPTKQDYPLEKDTRRLKKRTGSSDTSRMSSSSALECSTNRKRNSASQNLPPESTAATSWSSHSHFPRNPSTNEDLGTDDHHTQFTLGNDGITYNQGTGFYLPHIGAQFYEVVDGGTRMMMGQWEWDADHRYQIQAQPMANDISPMERYQQQAIRDEPYGDMIVNIMRQNSDMHFQ